jgi:hypothetical protein
MLTPNEASQLDRWLTAPPDHGEVDPDQQEEQEDDASDDDN